MTKLKGGMIKLKAEKLPSGNWRVQVLDYIDVNGKPHKKSFTASTKAEAEFMAAKFKTERTEGRRDGIVADMVERVIRTKASALAPSTLKGYEKILRTNIKPAPFGKVRVSALSSQKVQAWVSWMINRGLSPKTVKNAVGVFTSCYQAAGGDRLFKVTLPHATAQRRRVPSIADVDAVLDFFKDDPDMTAAIRLAAYGGLRRGEICALTAKDVRRNARTIIVNKAVTETKDGLITRQPKTTASVRPVLVSQFVIDALPKTGKCVNIPPHQVTNRFCRAVAQLPVIPFSFHDLRHFFASFAHNKGVSDITIQAAAGWSSAATMKGIYWGEISEETKAQMDKVNGFVDSKYSREISREM